MKHTPWDELSCVLSYGTTLYIGTPDYAHEPHRQLFASAQLPHLFWLVLFLPVYLFFILS